MYCNDIEELVAMVLNHRSQETNDVDIKLCVDGRQGFLKVTLSITLKPELEYNKIPESVTNMRGKILKVQVSTKQLYWPFCLKKYHN